MSKANVLTVNVVTPDGRIYEGTGKSVICTTTKGSIGFMPNRVPILASLAIDVVKIRKEDDSVEEIAVTGGFIEFSDNVLNVVASAAECVEDIDVERAKAARERALKHIQDAKVSKDINDLRRAEIALRRAINRLKLTNN
ncbi:F0F1 ATP synthase subunit epsilon [Ligilactobacillus ceti]|uniref:ATP synthase epsilon chain n=1 Tax=Ligilactobacillus ceti DSM 22408 TaxID=1122146 RepID=A0A0R2KIJ0_9LACO|nr:F0F1 ATP synthase subunit epsilon [Ligilactobacillus ceti]KRN89003.1 ATP synthase epsilon chain [Ligilactobacillus ceti DSM 22408]